MAVTIQLDVDAGGATGKIGAVAASLKGLEHTASDIDLDFDADIGEITEEIEKFSEALEGLDVDMDQVGQDIRKAAKEIDGAEVSVVADSPDGGTGKGDSTGSDPPEDLVHNLTPFGGDVDTDAASATDGGERADLFERTYGPDAIHMSDSDIGDMLKKRSGGGLTNLGEHSPLIPDYDARQRIATRGRYGMEPESMGDRRNANVLSNKRADRIDFELEGTDSVRQELSKREARGLPTPSPTRGFDIDRINSIDLRSLNNGFGKFEKKLKRLTPSMSQYMQLLAAIIPMLVTFAVQALGVAAALGAVAAAGASIIGLGLLGHGDSMAESFGQAKQELRGLKEAMFNTFQPTMQQFAPIQSEAFDSMPGALRPVAEEMESLADYEDTLFNLGGALAGGMEKAVEVMVRNEEAVSSLSKRFGGIIGSGLIGFFEWLVKEAYESQELLVSLGETFVTLAVLAYQLSKFVSKLVVAFQPLFEIITSVSGFLNNDFIVGFLVLMATWGSFILLTSKVVTSLYAVAAALSTVGGSGLIATIVAGIARITGMLWGLIAAAWEANLALGVLASLATLGLAAGAAMVSYGAIEGMMPNGASGSGVGGGGGMGGGSTGGGTVYHDNRSYTFESGGDDYASQKFIEDTVKNVNETESAQSVPDATTNSTESNT